MSEKKNNIKHTINSFFRFFKVIYCTNLLDLTIGGQHATGLSCVEEESNKGKKKNAPFYGDPEQRHVDMLTAVVILISNWGFRFIELAVKKKKLHKVLWRITGSNNTMAGKHLNHDVTL